MKNFSNKERVLILAAGRGSRLKELTKYNPKCFIKIKNKEIINHQINEIKKNGVKKIGIVVGYKKKKFERLGVKLFFNNNWKTTNMVYSLFQAKKWLFNYNCIICYGDIVYDGKIISKLIKSKYDFVLPSNQNWKGNWKLRYKNPLSDLETFKVNKIKNLMEIGNKPKNYLNIDGQFMGIIKINKNISRKIFKIYDSFEYNYKKNLQFTNFLNICIKDFNLKIKTLPVKNYWFELDNKNDFKVIKNKF